MKGLAGVLRDLFVFAGMLFDPLIGKTLQWANF
jgi:hypothetical protein